MPRGGFQRPYMIGTWVRDAMVGGRVSYALELYGDFKNYLERLPLSGERRQEAIRAGRIRSRRRVPSYSEFRIYLYLLRRKGLLQYTGDKVASDNPNLDDRLPFVAVDIGSTRWDEPVFA